MTLRVLEVSHLTRTGSVGCASHSPALAPFFFQHLTTLYHSRGCLSRLASGSGAAVPFHDAHANSID